MTFYDLCCGTGAITLRLLSPFAESLPMMGRKADFATSILDLMDLRGVRPDRIVMADCGPWGEFWRVVAESQRGEAVARVIEGFAGDGDDLFAVLSIEAPPHDSIAFAAAFACLQTANASGRAVQVSDQRWKTHGYAHLTDSARDKGFPERLRKRQVADRVRSFAGLDWPPTRVITCDLRYAQIEPEFGDVVVVDPPYKGTTGYHGLDLTRAEVAHLARVAAARGARVGICEGEPVRALTDSGWWSSQVAGGSWRKAKSEKVEWLTTSFEAAQPEQLSFGGGL